MTDAKKKPPLTGEKQRLRVEQHLKEVYLDGLWEKFCLIGKPADLGMFVLLGGNIDSQERRDLIADLLDNTPHKNPGGALTCPEKSGPG